MEDSIFASKSARETPHSLRLKLVVHRKIAFINNDHKALQSADIADKG
jgi:hypothetical protein